MKYVTFDFESYFDSDCSLTRLSVEEYLRHPKFKVFGVGISIDGAPAYWITEGIREHLDELLKTPTTLIAHNMQYDGGVLAFHYGLTATVYHCTLALGSALFPQYRNSLERLLFNLFPDEQYRKGDELKQFKGVENPTPGQLEILGKYCCNDTDQTWRIYREVRSRGFPQGELMLIHWTQRIFIEPLLEFDRPRARQYLETLKIERRDTIQNIEDTYHVAETVDEAVADLRDVLGSLFSDSTFGHDTIVKELVRVDKFMRGFTQELPKRKTDTANKLKLIEAIREHYEDLAAHRLAAYCWPEAEAEDVLASTTKFPEFVAHATPAHIPRIASPTEKNPRNTKWALGKTDLDFLDVRTAHPDHLPLWQARFLVSSNIEYSRCERLLSHTEACGYKPENVLAVPLKYHAAATSRFGGNNKSNLQNLQQRSELRRCMRAPDGYQMVVYDQAGVELKVGAWLAQEHRLIDCFREGRDLHSEFAEILFKRPIDKDIDEVERFAAKTCNFLLIYGGGGTTLDIQLRQGKTPVSLGLQFANNAVQTYRQTNTAIVKCWRDFDNHIAAMANPNMTPYQYGCLEIHPGAIRFPDGLFLTFPNLRAIRSSDETRVEYSYMAREPGYTITEDDEGDTWLDSNDGPDKRLWGSLVYQNSVQKLARITMVEALLRVEEQYQPLGGRVVSNVHDELWGIAPNKHAERAAEIMHTELCRLPDWADDSLILGASGGYGQTYEK